MGWWGTGQGDDVIGDEPADTLTAAVDELAGAPERPTLASFLDALGASLREIAGRWWDGSAADVTRLTAVVAPLGDRVPAGGAAPDRDLVEALSETFDSVADDYLEDLDRLPRLRELLHLVAFVLGDRPDLAIAGLSPGDSIEAVRVD